MHYEDMHIHKELVLHLRSASRLRSWANPFQYLYFTHCLYRWIVQHSSATIRSFISLSPLKAFLKVCFLSKIVFLTFGPGSVITVSLSTQIKLTQFSLALAINSVLYLLSHMSMLQAPRYSYQKKWKFLEQHSISSSLFRIMSTQYVVLPSITCALSVTFGQLLLKI